MARRIRHGDHAALAKPCQRKAAKLECVDDRLEVANHGVEGEITHIPVRETRTPRVIANQHSLVNQCLGPMPPDRTTPVEFEVREPVFDADQGRAVARGCACDPRVIA